MKFSGSERETLSGPAVVGAVLGLLCAMGAMGFHSEYGHASQPAWPVALDMIGYFAAGFLVAFLPFGAVPVLVARLKSRKQRDDT